MTISYSIATKFRFEKVIVNQFTMHDILSLIYAFMVNKNKT